MRPTFANWWDRLTYIVAEAQFLVAGVIVAGGFGLVVEPFTLFDRCDALPKILRQAQRDSLFRHSITSVSTPYLNTAMRDTPLTAVCGTSDARMRGLNDVWYIRGRKRVGQVCLSPACCVRSQHSFVPW